MLLGNDLRDVSITHSRLQPVERGRDGVLGDLDRAAHAQYLLRRLDESQLLEGSGAVDKLRIGERA